MTARSAYASEEPAAAAAGRRERLRGYLTPQNALLAGQIACLLAMTAVVTSRTWQDHLWVGFGLVGLATAAWLPELRRHRARRWWFAYVAGIFFYTLLRSLADDTGIPIRTDYVVISDRLLFFGTDPVVWLQRRFFDPPGLTWLDWVAVQVHWSFFVAPHLAAVVIFLRRRHQFPAYALLVLGTMYLGLLVFFVIPTEPPWFAARTGDVAHVVRIMDFVGGRANESAYNALSTSLGEPNSVAAMPSIHMGVTFAMYLWTRDHYRRLSPYVLGYTAIMGVALVYLAEHWVLDLLAGVACAWVGNQVARRVAARFEMAPAEAVASAPG